MATIISHVIRLFFGSSGVLLSCYLLCIQVYGGGISGTSLVAYKKDIDGSFTRLWESVGQRNKKWRTAHVPLVAGTFSVSFKGILENADLRSYVAIYNITIANELCEPIEGKYNIIFEH